MLTEIRDALVAAVESPFAAAFPLMPMVVDNGPFDWNNPPALFVEYQVEFNWGKRMTLGGPLKTRIMGFVYATVRAGKGTGDRKALQVQDWFCAKLGEASLVAPGYRIILQAPRPEPLPDWNGWGSRGVKFSFTADPT